MYYYVWIAILAFCPGVCIFLRRRSDLRRWQILGIVVVGQTSYKRGAPSTVHLPWSYCRSRRGILAHGGEQLGSETLGVQERIHI